MITQYDMASYEMILDPETASPRAAAVEGTAQLRLQTVDEAIAIEERIRSAMPADLLQADPSKFVDSQ